ncbi:TVP38/TMEM64 family protein [Paenibacillus albicereus]|uniref:TVP38/TMEM64 family membrane protein n=1 Tax=Paenibacillus albicereus TaxID=2726185 RepID=A0A6H2GVN2_9BACL|nr:TVP38/TMEM64 family protein [Paenibacillus albicereus]QJC51483.1 TVP38/TMEM64 family protein [Paenibacillus albicereus]
MMKKISMTILYAWVAVVVYLYREPILGWIESQESAIPVMLAATGMALFPVIPYPVVGAVIGAAYGPIQGGIVTWVGSTAASLLMFLFIRYVFRDWGSRVLARYGRLDRMTQLFERNAFLMILFARLIPFIPSVVINVYAALSRVSFGVYATASALGKVPSMLLFVIIGDGLVYDARSIWAAAAIYVVFLAATLTGYRGWARRNSIRQSP